MSDERFDLVFDGLIAPGADRAEARGKIAAIFKLSDEGADRLFSGKPKAIKRDVDAATAEQFETVFARAGAILTIVAKGGATAPDEEGAGSAPHPGANTGAPRTRAVTPEQTKPAKDDRLAPIDTSHLSLAPLGEDLEKPQPQPERPIDTSYLSLVLDEDWTLEDCEPPPTPVLLPDLSGLALIPQPPKEDKESSVDY